MAISDTIQSMYENVGNVYDVLELAGADLTNVDKNIENLKQSWEERLLYFLANGTDVVWNNWLPKVNGTGESITLNNTIQAKMDFIYKGNTSQESTTGKNLVDFGTQSFTTYKDYTNLNISAGTYTFSAIVTSSDTSQNVSRVYFYGENGSTEQAFITLSRNTRANATVTTTFDIKRIILYSSIDYSSSNGKTATFKDIQLETGSTASDYEPYTGGNPAPNPDYPYPVNVVTGDNEINVVGKNIFDLDWFTFRTNNGITATKGDGYVLLNGTATATAFINYKIPRSLGTSTTNYWYVKSDSARIMLKVKRAGQNDINISPTAGTQMQQGIGNNISYVYDGYIQITNGTTLNNCKVYIDVRNAYLSLQDYVFEPYVSSSYNVNLGDIELCKIGDYQDYIAKSSGKNLFNSINWKTTASGGGFPVASNNYSTIVSSDINNIEFNVSVAYGGVESDFIPVKSGETYTISFSGQGTLPNRFFVTQYDNTKTRVSTLNTSVTTISTTTFTTTQEGYIAIGFNNTTSSSSNFTINNIMLNKGTSALPYEPFGKVWCKYGAVGKVVLDGSENWGVDSSGGYNNYKISLSDAMGNDSAVSCLSQYFTGATGNQSWSGAVDNSIGIGGSKTLRIRRTSFADTTAFTTWLSTHNTIVYYVLNTPTITEITDTTLINQLEAIKLSYNEQTNISQTNTDKPFILDVTALKDLDAEDTTPALTTNRGLLFTQPPVSENFINDEDDNSILEEIINEEEPNIEDDNREEEEPLDFFEKEIINNDEEQEEIPPEPIEIDNGQR